MENVTLTETGPKLSWETAMAASLFPLGAMAALDTVDTNQGGKVAMVAPPPDSLGSNGSNQLKVRREEKTFQPAAVIPSQLQQLLDHSERELGVSSCPSGCCSVCHDGKSMLPLPWWLC